jgi:ATP-dependent Lhr-like helicase
VTNDQFDVVRQGPGRTDANVTNGTPQRRLSLRRRATERPEGRWALVPWAQVDDESLALGQVERLLRRYGIVCRELALLDPWMVSWRSLYDVLSRLELTGEVRRGYFVEGLSGAQFALPLAACKLQDLEALSRPDQPLVLVHSQDPANLYGTGAPFDVPLLEGGKRPFIRRSGNWLILRGGRPVLLIEQQGRKLTALDSASRPEMREAVGLIPTILQKDQGIKSRNRLIVEEWNDQPVMNTEGQELLEAAGFVRDYQGMALYKKG